MTQLNAALVHDIIQSATTGENRAIVEATPALSWMLPELDAHRERLGELLGGRAEDETVSELRERARAVDVDFDRAHRFLYHLLKAGAHVEDPAQAAAIARATDVLYADGLRVVNQTWRQAAASTTTFKNQLERSDVLAGIEAAGGYIKRVKDVIKDVVRAGEALTEIVAKLDAGEAEATALPPDQALFEARRAGLSAWSLFASNVAHVLAADDAARNRLLQRWNALRAELAQSPSTPAATPSDSPSEAVTASEDA